MKEALLAIIMAFFPAKEHDDACGYCHHEFKEGVSIGGGYYKLTHHAQGAFITDKEGYEFFTAKSSSEFRCDTPRADGRQHVANFTVWEYSWLDLPYLLIEHNRDSRIPTGCWNSN